MERMKIKEKLNVKRAGTFNTDKEETEILKDEQFYLKDELKFTEDEDEVIIAEEYVDNVDREIIN